MYFASTGSAEYGFLLAADGTVVKLDVPGALITSPQSINSEGEITGFYGLGTGFVRRRDGRFVTFNVPKSIFTLPMSINNKGEIAGSYEEDGNPYSHGFLRTWRARGR